MMPFGLGCWSIPILLVCSRTAESFVASSARTKSVLPHATKRITRLHGAMYEGIPVEEIISLAKGLVPNTDAIVAAAPTWDLLPKLSLTMPSLPELPPWHPLFMGVPTDASLPFSALFEGTTLPPSVEALLQPFLQVLSNVDPAARPLLLAPLLALVAGKALEAWDGIGVEAEDQGNSLVSSPFKAEGQGTGTYDDQAANAYYGDRPLLVLKRLLSLAQLTGTFNLKLLFDFLRTPEGAPNWINEEDRAKEALVLANLLGPTFIKLGQAASIRTDLIPEPYALELRQLQDAVPPFSSEEAMAVLRRELGVTDLAEVFSALSPEPVASASIGQVYKGTLKSSGVEVAVKVQRPSVLSEISLDLFLLRLLTPLQVRASNFVNKVKTEDGDIATALALVDEWGRGFVAEVDYRLEAKNTKAFKAAMERRNLKAVTAPTVVDELSTSVVLVTEWVQGTRLDRDASADVPRLCGVAINAYLTMLLDTGTLHCDPHPGNLLRTTDGRLCVLDWGMTLEVPKDLQYGLLEFIAHVNSEDFEAIPRDFVNLGFTPPDKLEKVEASGITEGLTFALRQLSKGGGANKMRARLKQEFVDRYGEGLSDDEIRAKAREEMLERMEQQLESEGVDVNQVTNVMEEMSKRNRELFQLPPYVLYVSRAFSTLEGIGLSVDEDYAILQECYPYLAKRLLTDNSPRARNALLAMLYGNGAGDDDDSLQLSLDRASLESAVTGEGIGGNGIGGGGGGGGGGAAFAAKGVTAAQAAAVEGRQSDGGSRRRRQRGFVGRGASGQHQNAEPGSSGSAAGSGLLSADKVVEMASGFTSYTAATSSAQNDRGMLEARNGLVDLVLADFGPQQQTQGLEGGNGALSPATSDGPQSPNVVQEVVVEETARLIDAAIAQALAAAVKSVTGERSPEAAAAAENSWVESLVLSTLVPGPLKPFAETTLQAQRQASRAVAQQLQASVAQLIPDNVKRSSMALLDATTAEDEKVLSAATALVNAAIQQQGTMATTADADTQTSNDHEEPFSALTSLGNGGDALEVARSALTTLLKASGSDGGDESDGGDGDGDVELLKKLRDKGPGAAARLSRLLAASLVARAADRLDAATEAQVASGLIKQGGAVSGARSAATKNLLDPLLEVLER